MPVLPGRHFEWQVLRTVKRSKTPPTGRALRLVPTRELMVGFYRRLLAGEGKADARRHAQKELRARPEFADPYDWAAFVLLGDPGPLRELPHAATEANN